MLRSTAILAAVLSLSAFAKADKFHLSKADETSKTEGNAAGRVIEGALVKEEDGMYVIRVVGGEMRLPKAQVVKHEKDGLTVAQIEAQEKGMQDALAQQNTQRRELLAAEADDFDRAIAAEASARRGTAEDMGPKTLQIDVDFKGLLPSYRFKSPYDPVLNRANFSGLRSLIETYLREEVERAANRRK